MHTLIAFGGFSAMFIRRRCFAPLVALITAAYLVSSIGCATARVRSAGSPAPLRVQGAEMQTPAASAVSYAEATGDAALSSASAQASYDQPLLTTTSGGSVDIDQIVRGQDDHGYGPIKEFLWSPYTIGVLFVAALVVPAATN